MKIVLATHNKHKTFEFKRILSASNADIEILTLDDIGFTDEIIEDGSTFEENAFIKASAVAKLGYIGIADDSGLCVDALDGAPGIYSARYAGSDCNDKENNKKLLINLSGVEKDKRSAKFVCAIACAFPNGNGNFSVRGESKGFITYEESGNGGFGYDPLFYCPDFGKTFAELSADEKNSISHRGRAIKLFCKKFINETSNK